MFSSVKKYKLIFTSFACEQLIYEQEKRLKLLSFYQKIKTIFEMT